ncbi:MAG TPA: ABC transporter permease [bacterium]|nr:ABC transporter permease [bacterium]
MSKGPGPSWSFRFFLPLVAPVLVLFLWQGASDLGWIKPALLPAPLAVGKAFLDLLASGELWHHWRVSMVRVLEGFLAGSGLGILLGLGLGLSPRLERALWLVTGFLRPIPTIAWIPVLILWMGIDEGSKVTVIAVGSFWPVLLNTLRGVRDTDPKLLEVARALEKGPRTLLLRVVLPSAFPAILTGLRIAMGIAWASVVGAELIAASAGVGYLIMYAREVSQPDVMLAGVAVIGLTGILIDLAFERTERRFLRWQTRGEGQ